jgi:hypothetical protein
MDDWAQQRRAQLEAAAPVKRKKIEPFVKVRLATAATAYTAMNCPKAMVCTVPNGALAKFGVSRKVKSLALRQLEAAGLDHR